MKRGLLGGTFDPPHIVHLLAGELAARQLGLDVVTFLPAGDPWQKGDREITGSGHRWEMVSRSVAGVEYFEADDREIRRQGPTYTIDTLEEFGGDELFLILGSDAAAAIPTWHRAQEVLDRVSLAVLPRPGTPPRGRRGHRGRSRVARCPRVADQFNHVAPAWSERPDHQVLHARCRMALLQREGPLWAVTTSQR